MILAVFHENLRQAPNDGCRHGKLRVCHSRGCGDERVSRGGRDPRRHVIARRERLLPTLDDYDESVQDRERRASRQRATAWKPGRSAHSSGVRLNPRNGGRYVRVRVYNDSVRGSGGSSSNSICSTITGATSATRWDICPTATPRGGGCETVAPAACLIEGTSGLASCFFLTPSPAAPGGR